MKTMEKDKCEWCEERRYTLIRNEEVGALYCMNLDKDDTGYFMEILRQRPPRAIWERRYIKHINYCPFCGRKLEIIEDTPKEDAYKRINKAIEYINECTKITAGCGLYPLDEVYAINIIDILRGEENESN